MLPIQMIDVEHAAAHLPSLIDRVMAGEEIGLTRGGEPVARLVPVEQHPVKREFGALRSQLSIPDSFFDPLPENEQAQWES